MSAWLDYCSRKNLACGGEISSPWTGSQGHRYCKEGVLGMAVSCKGGTRFQDCVCAWLVPM